MQVLKTWAKKNGKILLAGRALAELDNAHLEGPQAQAKAFQDALNVLKQNEGVKTPGDSLLQ